jgi:hypothetical protein
MACWDGLSAAQQTRLIVMGNLPLGYQPHGECREPATCCIETQEDAAPGPRFYCYSHAIAYLLRLKQDIDVLPDDRSELPDDWRELQEPG